MKRKNLLMLLTTLVVLASGFFVTNYALLKGDIGLPVETFETQDGGIDLGGGGDLGGGLGGTDGGQMDDGVLIDLDGDITYPGPGGGTDGGGDDTPEPGDDDGGAVLDDPQYQESDGLDNIGYAPGGGGTGNDDDDGDGLTNDEEDNLGTDPDNDDSDGDTLEDGEEVDDGTDPLNDDSDGDYLNDEEEKVNGSNPLDADTDNDSLDDYDEVVSYHTDPNDTDTDNDGASDGQEAVTYDTDPSNADTDGDGVNDGDEIRAGTDPLDDSDFSIDYCGNFAIDNPSEGEVQTGDTFEITVTVNAETLEGLQYNGEIYYTSTDDTATFNGVAGSQFLTDTSVEYVGTESATIEVSASAQDDPDQNCLDDVSFILEPEEVAAEVTPQTNYCGNFSITSPTEGNVQVGDNYEIVVNVDATNLDGSDYEDEIFYASTDSSATFNGYPTPVLLSDTSVNYLGNESANIEVSAPGDTDPDQNCLDDVNFVLEPADEETPESIAGEEETPADEEDDNVAVLDNDCIDPFVDTEGHWAEVKVCELYVQDVVDGKSTNLYVPNDYMTRAEFLKVLMGAAGFDLGDASGLTESYTDVYGSDWYYPWIALAESEGILRNQGGAYRPNDPVTRADAAVLTVRLAGLTLYGYTEADIDYFDVHTTDYFAYAVILSSDEVVMVEGEGNQSVIEGYGDGSFRPYSYMTRAEVATMLLRAQLAWF